MEYVIKRECHGCDYIPKVMLECLNNIRAVLMSDILKNGRCQEVLRPKKCETVPRETLLDYDMSGSGTDIGALCLPIGFHKG